MCFPGLFCSDILYIECLHFIGGKSKIKYIKVACLMVLLCRTGNRDHAALEVAAEQDLRPLLAVLFAVLSEQRSVFGHLKDFASLAGKVEGRVRLGNYAVLLAELDNIVILTCGIAATM